jgi:ring-1,2-phenylacetyl-CoA epoxidase subunit PaaC
MSSSAEALLAARVQYLLRLGDTSLVLAQRLGEWVGYAPALEEELSLGNLALDCLDQARTLLSYAAELEDAGRDEDILAFGREQNDFRNLNLVEQPNGDFAVTIVRQALFDAWQRVLLESLLNSADARLAVFAEKSLKECRYHWRFSRGWLVRLGDGTEESQRRTQVALDQLWPFTGELFCTDDVDALMVEAAICGDLSDLAPRWNALIDGALEEGRLVRPPAPRPDQSFGKRGEHSEALGHLLAVMQSLPRAHPGLRW